MAIRAGVQPYYTGAAVGIGGCVARRVLGTLGIRTETYHTSRKQNACLHSLKRTRLRT